MVNLSREELRAMMGRARHVRNVCVIAHVDHGKTTLTDQLLARAGVLAAGQAGDRRATDDRQDERLRGITIKSSAISLYYELTKAELAYLPAGVGREGGREHLPAGAGREVGREQGFLINLIDSPGHVDFSSEVTAALRLTDGAMVVVDCVSGVCVQTETVLRQAVTERVRPVLMMNKLDRCILEKQMEHEQLYQHLYKVIARVNTIIDTYQDDDPRLDRTTIEPTLGNVAFGAGLHGWGFTLRQMAAIYSRRLGMDESKITKRLWGDHFYNPDTHKWNTIGGPGYVRAFNKFVLEPLYKVLNAALGNSEDDLGSLLEKIDVTLSVDELAQTSRERMRAVMRKWLPAGDAMLQMIVVCLPSPVTAQAYRAELLYEGPMDDEAGVGMKNCNPDGPLMLYVSKMIPTAEGRRFYAFGRVFSGTVSTGQKVRVLGPDFRPGQKEARDVHITTIPRTVVMMGGNGVSVDSVPCGSIVGLVGIDKYLRKTGTITTFEKAHNMKTMKFSVSPVVRVAVVPESAVDLPKLIVGLRRLAKSDPMVECSRDESGQHIVAGAGELHLEICLNDLEQFTGAPIKRSDPVVGYRESVSATSRIACLAKSTNKHNRLWMQASPLSDELVDEIQEGKVHPSQDRKGRARHLADVHGFDVNAARKIWCFGPEGRGENILVDVTKCIQNLSDIKDPVMAGFQWAMLEGPLCDERMRGVRVDVVDAMIHSDPACRKGGQVIPAARRAAIAAVLTAQPRLLEPVYLVEIQCPETVIGGVYSSLTPRRGHVFEESRVLGTPLFNMKAYLPVCESFGFTQDLRGATGGQGFPQCVFDHWQLMPGDPLDPSTKSGGVTASVRRRKGLPDNIPALETFLDKL